MRCTHIYITKCNHFAQTGFIQFLCDLASTVTDTDKSDSHFFGMALALDGIQKEGIAAAAERAAARFRNERREISSDFMVNILDKLLMFACT